VEREEFGSTQMKQTKSLSPTPVSTCSNLDCIYIKTSSSSSLYCLNAIGVLFNRLFFVLFFKINYKMK
jgi:hypothetical protein